MDERWGINKTMKGKERVPRNDWTRKEWRMKTKNRWSDFHFEGWMNSNGDHGAGNVFVTEIWKKKLDRANDRTPSIYTYVCVYAELRIASTKEGKKKNRKRRKKVEDSVLEEAKRGKKFVTTKRNGGLWKNSERKARRRSNRFPFSIKNSMNRHASVYRFLGSRIVSAGDGKTDERANVENLFCPGRCANIRL